jgi:hypothetical protein
MISPENLLMVPLHYTDTNFLSGGESKDVRIIKRHVTFSLSIFIRNRFQRRSS